MHFFSPANVMRLLEVVRGAKTAKPMIATAMRLARKIGKIGVLVGVCHGFVGNRMLHQRQREAQKLILEGAMPWDVDRVIYDFGLPMGPFAMSDLAGLDIGWSKATSKSSTIREILWIGADRRPALVTTIMTRRGMRSPRRWSKRSFSTLPPSRASSAAQLPM